MNTICMQCRLFFHWHNGSITFENTYVLNSGNKKDQETRTVHETHVGFPLKCLADYIYKQLISN